VRQKKNLGISPKHAYEAKIIGGELAWPKDEILNAGWFTLDEIRGMKNKLRSSWIMEAIDIMEKNIVLQVGVKALLQNEQGEYLLLHRSLIKYPEIKGSWDIVGGRIEVGKTLLENLQREIKEETGLIFKGVPKLIAAQDILRNPERHVVRLTYLGQVTGTVSLDVTENDDFKWCDWKELNEVEDMDIYFKQLLEDKTFLEK